MPELPEVETVRKILEPQLAGRTIVRLTLNRPDIIDHPSAEIFSERITGMQIAGMGRRGKFLSLKLANQERLILHLRMTGQLLVTPPDDPVEKHTHIIFHLDNGKELRFTDPRRFGRFWLLSNGEEDIYSGIHKLGIEPFDSCLTADWLQRQIGRRKKTIKECLLEQKTVAPAAGPVLQESFFPAEAASIARNVKRGTRQLTVTKVPVPVGRLTSTHLITENIIQGLNCNGRWILRQSL